MSPFWAGFNIYGGFVHTVAASSWLDDPSLPRGLELSMTLTAQSRPDPRRYFEAVGDERGAIAEQEPVCLYLETTNRCNLLCETCPRTFEELEPPADMSWELSPHRRPVSASLARRIARGRRADDGQGAARMVRYLKERGTYVLFNTTHLVDRAQGQRVDRSRSRRVARVARRRRA